MTNTNKTRSIMVLAAILTGIACGGADEGEREPGVEYPDPIVAFDQVAQAVSYISCPYPPGGGMILQVNNCGLRKLECYKLGVKYAEVSYPASATSCCPAGFCPNQKCYTPTGAAALICNP